METLRELGDDSGNFSCFHGFVSRLNGVILRFVWAVDVVSVQVELHEPFAVSFGDAGEGFGFLGGGKGGVHDFDLVSGKVCRGMEPRRVGELVFNVKTEVGAVFQAGDFSPQHFPGFRPLIKPAVGAFPF